MRKSTIVMLTKIKGRRSIHFTAQPLCGSNNSVWIPIGGEDLLRAIENIMVINNEAVNVTSLRSVREHNEDCFDYEVTYNVG